MSKKIYVIITVIIIAAAGVFVAGLMLKGRNKIDFDGPTYTVKSGPLTISYTEQGTIKARERTIIKNEVEGRRAIISIVPEGTKVKKGDLLVELDVSTLEDKKVDEEIRAQNTEASYINAKENLAVVKNQAKSDIELAELKFEFAKQDLEKYTKGEYPYELEKADAQITLAEEELIRAKDRLKYSKDLYEEKYISQTELQADEIAKNKKELDTKLAKKSKELLSEYTKQRKVAELKSDVSQAQMALERVKRKANANVIQAEANLKAREAEYNKQKTRLEKVIDQIAKTKIYAPSDGLVIYATSATRRWWSNEPLEEGKEVREREELIHLPIGDAVNAELSIHESNLKKTKKGTPAVVTIGEMGGKKYFGTVEQIAPLPDAQSMWMNPDLKVYKSEIFIDSNDPALRTGRSCQCEVIIQQYQDVIAVPMQAVVKVGSEQTVYVLNNNSVVPRKVEIGLDNNKMVHIISGLKESEIILLNPPLKSTAQTGSKPDTADYKNLSIQDRITQGLKDAEKRQQQQKLKEKQALSKAKENKVADPNADKITDKQKPNNKQRPTQ